MLYKLINDDLSPTLESCKKKWNWTNENPKLWCHVRGSHWHAQIAEQMATFPTQHWQRNHAQNSKKKRCLNSIFIAIFNSYAFFLFLSGSPRKLWTARSSWTSWSWHWHVRLCWTRSDREGSRPPQVHEGRPSLRKPAPARRRSRCHAQVSQQPDWEHPEPRGIQEESRSHLQGPEALPPWLEERWVTASGINASGGNLRGRV